MKAKSDLLAASRRASAVRPRPRRAPRVRLPREERRAQILAQAYKFFSEYGLTAQTRALAEACGVSQRLLYSFFPMELSVVGLLNIQYAIQNGMVYVLEVNPRGVCSPFNVL